MNTKPKCLQRPVVNTSNINILAGRLVVLCIVASQCLGYRLCAKFRVVFKIPKVPNSLSVQISGSFINEAWYHFWPNI